MRMRPVHGVVVATAVGTAAAFGASAIKDTTHLGAAAKAQSGKKVDRIVKTRARTLDAQEKALRKARRYRTPALPKVPAAPGPVPSYSYAAPARPVAAATPPAPVKVLATRHVTLTRVVHRRPLQTGPSHRNRDLGEPTTTSTTTTTTEDTPTTTAPSVTTTSQAPVTHTTSSTTSSGGSSGSGDSSHDGSDDGGSGSDS